MHASRGAREGRRHAIVTVEVAADERGVAQQDEGCRDLVRLGQPRRRRQLLERAAEPFAVIGDELAHRPVVGILGRGVDERAAAGVALADVGLDAGDHEVEQHVGVV